jgi:hypothetical protein
MEKTFHEINFSPFATNVLDVIGDKTLCRSDGTEVTVVRRNGGFEVHIGANVRWADSNAAASYILNMAQVGRLQ